MQLDKGLTLVKAITMARQSEEIKRQLKDLRGEAGKMAMGAVQIRKAKPNKFRSREQKHFKSSKPQKMKQDGKTCSKYARTPAHAAVQCPAKNTECHNCGKRGHYDRVCRSNPTMNEIADSADGLFLGVVDSGEEPWLVDINVTGNKVRFKLDSGADVTSVSQQTFKTLHPEISSWRCHKSHSMDQVYRYMH